MSIQPNNNHGFRGNEPTFEEIAAKYPEFPRLVMLKTDIHRRGVYYTEETLEAFDASVYQVGGTYTFGTRDGGKLTSRPQGFLLRDGTSVFASPTPLEQDPYIVDLVDGVPYLFDNGKALEEIEYWTKPDYYDKQTKSGVFMQNVINGSPQKLYITANRYCHFWNNGNGCRFCDIVNNLKHQKDEFNVQTRLKIEDIVETMEEALKEPGRFTTVSMTSGSDYRGDEAFETELNYYVDILNAIDNCFEVKKYPSHMICTALKKEQLQKLYDTTGISSVTMDIEVLNEKLFNEMCPGKAEWIGYKEWKKRLIDAVDIFGKGMVNTGIVSGIELVGENRFKTEDEALKAILEEAEELASYGVSTVNGVWIPRPNTHLAGEKNASLEYYVRLATGLQGLRAKYGIHVDFDDYRRCGNHPDSDLQRVF